MSKKKSYFDPFLKKEVFYIDTRLNLPKLGGHKYNKDKHNGNKDDKKEYLMDKLNDNPQLRYDFIKKIFELTDPVNANLFLRFLYMNNDLTNKVLSDDILTRYKIARTFSGDEKLSALSELWNVHMYNVDAD